MLFNEEQIRTIINNSTAYAGVQNAIIKGSPLGKISSDIDIERYGARLLSQPVVANPFVTALLQQFVYRATEANIFTSPFDYFREKREGVAFGSYETDVQPIFPLKYDMKAFDRILEFWETPVLAQYFAITRQDTFPQTVTKKIIRQAFTSYEAMDNFLSKLILASRNGNTIIETNAIKMMLNANVANGVIKREALGDYTTEAGAKQLAARIQEIAIGMTAEPSTDYNNYANVEGSNGVEAWTQSDRRDLCIIGSSAIISAIRTYVLAFAINKEEVDFNFHFIALKDFDFKYYNHETREFGENVTSPLGLIICDGGFIKLEDNFEDELSSENVMTAGIQRALQIEQTIGLRVWRNAIAFVDESETVEISNNNGLISADDTFESDITIPEGVTASLKILGTYGNNTAISPLMLYTLFDVDITSTDTGFNYKLTRRKINGSTVNIGDGELINVKAEIVKSTGETLDVVSVFSPSVVYDKNIIIFGTVGNAWNETDTYPNTEIKSFNTVYPYIITADGETTFDPDKFFVNGVYAGALEYKTSDILNLDKSTVIQLDDGEIKTLDITDVIDVTAFENVNSVTTGGDITIDADWALANASKFNNTVIILSIGDAGYFCYKPANAS